MRAPVLLLTLCLAACGHASDPVTPNDFRAADEACAPFGGLAAVRVSRTRTSTHMVAQCMNGAVIDFMPRLPKVYYHIG